MEALHAECTRLVSSRRGRSIVREVREKLSFQPPSPSPASSGEDPADYFTIAIKRVLCICFGDE